MNKSKKPPQQPGEMIIAQFKRYPFPLVAMWNGASQEWIAAAPQAGMFNGKWNDHYFENETFALEELESWRPIKQWKS
jgi:hypothetical protein